MSSALNGDGSTRRWRKLRAWYAMTLPRACWRCGQMIRPGDAWDLGHVVDRARGGSDDRLAPEHQACSRSAGGELGVQLRREGRPGAAQEWQGAGQGVTVGGRIVRDYPGGVRPATGSRYPGPSRDW